ncbi:MAG: hypothetical protein QME90_15070 [Thermodesulfobacteriota bacterium]|nr:hypothetical protein [Thermodesulfobacteriota bacterium]
MKSLEQKYQTVILKNTFYYFDEEFESEYEKHIFSVRETILHLKNEVELRRCNKTILENFLASKKELGLKALLAITGFSNESLKRLITVIRIVDDPELNVFTFKQHWSEFGQATREENVELSEWPTEKIEKLVRENENFRKCLVNIFFEGSTHDFFRKTLPTFEFQKLSIAKLNFEPNALIDTSDRYKEKGSRAAKSKNNPEVLVEAILDRNNITFEKGDLKELIENAPETKRTMDFIIPDKKDPKIIAESSFIVTTSSGQGDKSKTEISIDTLLKQHYPQAKFVGFVDGIGWYVRKGDLRRMVGAYEDVFTYHKDELVRFEQLLKEVFNK